MCKGKERCKVEPNNELLGDDGCPRKESKDMLMWTVYSCGGTEDKTTNYTKCTDDVTQISTTKTPPTRKECKQGKEQVRDVYGCGGWIDIWCPGSCINIHEALYSCTPRDKQSVKDLHSKKARDLCHGKERCKIQPTNELMGDEGCPGLENKKKQLWIYYSCEGYEDRTTHHESVCRKKNWG